MAVCDPARTAPHSVGLGAESVTFLGEQGDVGATREIYSQRVMVPDRRVMVARQNG